jgi:uncharacterized protein YjbJ (UPF0337 family)
MSAKTKQWTGRVKQAAGSLTGHKRLEREGAADRRSGQAGERIAHAKGKVNATIDKAAGAVRSVFRTGNNK